MNQLVERLQKIIKARFGAELRYEDLKNSDRELRDQLLRFAPLKKGSEWYFPVYNQYRLVGCAVISGDLAKLKSEEPILIELVELFLDAPLALSDQADLLTQVEATLRKGFAEQGGGGNVIPLRPTATTQAPTEKFSPSFKKQSRVGFALPCLLEGPTADDIMRLALELHELSGRYAFLSFQDLSVFTSQELMALGPITIFVPHIDRLNLDQQTLFSDYLARRPGVMHPQLIAGTLLNYPELRQSGLVTLDLLHRMSSCYLKMDRPFREYRKEGIVDFFFGGLSRTQMSTRLN